MKLWGLLAGLLAMLGSLWKIVWTATSRVKLKGKVKDHERADKIRDRVDSVDDDSVRKHDNSGFRD